MDKIKNSTMGIVAVIAAIAIVAIVALSMGNSTITGAVTGEFDPIECTKTLPNGKEVTVTVDTESTFGMEKAGFSCGGGVCFDPFQYQGLGNQAGEAACLEAFGTGTCFSQCQNFDGLFSPRDRHGYRSLCRINFQHPSKILLNGQNKP